MRRNVTMLAVISLTMILGCNQTTAPSKSSETGPMESTSTDFKGRLKAAQKITNSGTKNEALSKLAKDAAKAGEGEIVKQAIDDINQSGTKNLAASVAAVSLAEAGEGSAAVEVAAMINESGAANETFSKVAVAAAQNSDATVVKESVDKINQSGIGNKAAAAEAAVELAKTGQAEAAVEVAKLINEISLRNETLAKIAKGE